MRYFNTRYHNTVETIDELNPEDFKTTTEFRKELKRLKTEYIIGGTYVYTSSRCTKEWRTK